MQTRFHVLLIYTLFMSKASGPQSVAIAAIIMEINTSSSVWDVNGGSVVAGPGFHLIVARQGLKEVAS